MAGADSPCGHCERHLNHHCDYPRNNYCEHQLNYQLDHFDHHLDGHRDLAILFGKPEGNFFSFGRYGPHQPKSAIPRLITIWNMRFERYIFL